MESTQKTLLVTGGTGFIGTHTVVEILSERLGFEKIVIVDNLSNSNTRVLERLKEITGTNVEKTSSLKKLTSDIKLI